jgi:glycosyltransferase involved in cell wall biosynthesis
MSISACYITKNADEFLDTSIKSIKPFVNEIFIADDMSTDRTEEIAKANGAMFIQKDYSKLYPLDASVKGIGANKAKVAQRNDSIREASGDYILIMDDDEVYHENTMRIFVGYSQSRQSKELRFPFYHFWKCLDKRIVGHMWNMHPERFFKRKDGMQYIGRSDTVCLPNGEFNCQVEGTTNRNDMMCFHYSYLKDPAKIICKLRKYLLRDNPNVNESNVEEWLKKMPFCGGALNQPRYGSNGLYVAGCAENQEEKLLDFPIENHPKIVFKNPIIYRDYKKGADKYMETHWQFHNHLTFPRHQARIKYTSRFCFGNTLEMGCFLKDTKITMADKTLKNIQDIKKEDMVFSGCGNKQKVLSTFKRKYEGDLYSLDCGFGIKTQATKEHPFFVLDKQFKNILYNAKFDSEIETKCRWRAISELSKGDYIVLPILDNGYRREDLNKIILWGWYLSEGSVLYSHKPKLQGLGFALNINETNEANEIIRCAKNLGYNATISERKHRNLREIRVYSKEFADETVKKFGMYSDKKFIFDEVFTWNRDLIIEFINRVFVGDGCLRKNKNGGISYEYVTTSFELFRGIKRLLIYLGILSSEQIQNPVGKKRVYRLYISGTGCNILFNNVVKYNSRSISRKTKKYIFVPIQNISFEKIKEDVFNFEVENDNSYIADNISVHNCANGFSTHTLNTYAKEVHHDLMVSGYEITDWGYAEAIKNYPQYKFYKGFGEIMPFKDGEFDTVLMPEVIEHCLYPRALADEGWRVCSKRLIITTPTKMHPDPDHKRFFPMEEMRKFLSVYGEPKFYGLDENGNICDRNFYFLIAVIDKE